MNNAAFLLALNGFLKVFKLILMSLLQLYLQ